MTGAKDLAALSFTFTAGVIAGTCLTGHIAAICGGPAPWYGAGAISCALCAAAFCIAGKGRRHIMAKILFLYLSTGILCAVTSSLSCIGTAESGNAASGLASGVRSMIDGMPFRSGNTAPLLKALVTGDRTGLPPEIVRAFRESGASHILALSGLHLGIIYIILLKALSILGNAPWVKTARSLSIILFCGIYTAATGASASLVRAFLFIMLNESAKMLHRRSDPARVFCAALMFQLAISPEVIKSPGFQLSYLAMAGIIILLPRLKAWYPGDDKGSADPVRKIWNAMALAVSCQMFTAPAAWFHFRTFPRYFLITNLLALPVTSLLMMLSVASMGLYALGICPGILIRVTDFASDTLIFIVNIVSSM